jgi:hypothetical protein
MDAVEDLGMVMDGDIEQSEESEEEDEDMDGEGGNGGRGEEHGELFSGAVFLLAERFLEAQGGSLMDFHQRCGWLGFSEVREKDRGRFNKGGVSGVQERVNELEEEVRYECQVEKIR